MNDPREEKVVPMRTLDVIASYTIEKKVSVLTNDYSLEQDDDGNTFVDTEHTDWEAAYKADHHTVVDLLNKFAEYIRDEIRHIPKGSKRERELRMLMKECSGWVYTEAYEEA